MSVTERSGPGASLTAVPDASAQADSARPRSPFTVVIPSRDEAENVEALLSALASALDGLPSARVLFVDDSTDGTDELIRELAPCSGLEIRVLHRESATGGLGGAVAAGLSAAETPWCVVMDADLRHPPRLAPALVAEGERRDAQLVVGSRRRGGPRSEDSGGSIRPVISAVCGGLARLSFPRILSGISDPMSGFFAVRRDLWESAELQPDGHKILLELAVRTRPSAVAELPCGFQPRRGGTSKAGLFEGLRFLRNLTVLRASGTRARMLAFGLIGASGLLPNLAVTWALVRWSGVGYVAAAILANQAAMVWNFLLLDLLLFHQRRSGHWAWRLGRFAVLANFDLVGRIPLLSFLVRVAHLGPVWATGVTLLAASAVRFVVTDRALYRRADSAVAGPEAPPLAESALESP